MSFRSALRLATVVLSLGPALTAMASAQEAMQLDLEFRNSLLRGPAPREQGEARHLQQRQIDVVRHHPRRHRHRHGKVSPAIEGALTIPAGLRPQRRKLTRGSAAPADRQDHFVNLRLFTVYGRIGAQ